MLKAVICDVPADLLADRKRRGADRWDEMWDGVLHMSPAPAREHQDLLDELRNWLWERWARPFGNRVHREVNLASVGGWPHDYRIPDLVLLSPDRFHIDHNEYFEGPPLVVVEVHSPGDEALEKFDFYSELGAPEVWIVDRDTRKPQLFELKRGGYAEVAANADGWIVSRATGVQLRARRPKKLVLQLGDDADTRAALPEA